MPEVGSACIAIECVIPQGADDALAGRLCGLDILGTQLGQEGRDGLPVTVYVSGSNAALEVTVRRIVADLGGVTHGADVIADRNWLEIYRREVRPFTVGDRWWLDPHPERPTPAGGGRIRLAIEPRTAFGSGSHESTQLVLLELEAAPPRGLSVLDVGTGSGILALAAERLGARHVVGFDIDAGAVFVARQIVQQQEWRSLVQVAAAPIGAFRSGMFDVVLCNMIWEHSRPMLGELDRVAAAGGTIVFSGLLASDRPAIEATLEAAGLAVHGERRLAEWLCLRVGRG